MPLSFLTAGESHGPALTAILAGMPAGLEIDRAQIDRMLARRQVGFGSSARMRIEHGYAVVSAGVMDGRTTGAPIALTIPNRDHANWADRDIDPMTIPRPGHADLAAAVKYGYGDLRLGLERASARETAARVAVGALCIQLLAAFDIAIGSYVLAIGPVAVELSVGDDLPVEVDGPPGAEGPPGADGPAGADVPPGADVRPGAGVQFAADARAKIDYAGRFARAEADDLRCPDPAAAELMRDAIKTAIRTGDTLGGVFEVVALGVPPGLGSHVHWDRRLTGRLLGALASIPAVKGVELGPAFENARQPGSAVHGALALEGDRIVRENARGGGLEGGITTGQPISIRAAMKPIPTMLAPVDTIDLATGEPTTTRYERSDFCAVPRAAVVGEAMLAFVLADALLEKLGGDSLAEMRPRFAALRQGRLGELAMDNRPWRFGYTP